MTEYKPSIMRCLFLKIKSDVFTVIFTDTYHILTFDGEKYTTYNNKFWERFKNRVSYLNEQENDFCFVSDDEKWDIPEWITKSACNTTESMWNYNTLADALNVLQLNYNMYIKDLYGDTVYNYRSTFPDKKYELKINYMAKQKNKDNAKRSNNSGVSEFERYFRNALIKDKERNKI